MSHERLSSETVEARRKSAEAHAHAFWGIAEPVVSNRLTTEHPHTEQGRNHLLRAADRKVVFLESPTRQEFRDNRAEAIAGLLCGLASFVPHVLVSMLGTTALVMGLGRVLRASLSHPNWAVKCVGAASAMGAFGLLMFAFQPPFAAFVFCSAAFTFGALYPEFFGGALRKLF